MDQSITQLYADNPVTDFNGQELIEVVDKNGLSGAAKKTPFKQICISLSQTGTSAPTGTVHFQNIGGNGVLSYLSPGNYLLTQAGAFPAGKVPIVTKIIFGEVGGDPVKSILISRFSDDALSIGTFIDNVASNGVITNTYIEIPIFF